MFSNLQVKFRTTITPCQIQNCECGNDIITVTQISGFTSLTTGVDKEKLLENSSLDEFFRDFHHNPFVYYSSSGERQAIEAEIERHLGIVPLDVYAGKVDYRTQTGKLSDEVKSDPWSLHNLQGIYRVLLMHRYEVGYYSGEDFVEQISKRFTSPQSFVAFLNMIYDLGFLSSRMIGEQFIKNDIEPLASKGVAAKEAQKKRVDASGKVANRNRHKRIEGMLAKMEVLVAENPAFRRLNISQIADLAIEDAVKEEPSLWSQGKGRRDEYVDELHSDIRYRNRFQVLKSKTA